MGRRNSIRRESTKKEGPKSSRDKSMARTVGGRRGRSTYFVTPDLSCARELGREIITAKKISRKSKKKNGCIPVVHFTPGLVPKNINIRKTA